MTVCPLLDTGMAVCTQRRGGGDTTVAQAADRENHCRGADTDSSVETGLQRLRKRQTREI